jgi:hypothetical protein
MLSAMAPVALRWWPTIDDDPVRAAAECAAGLRALEACLEADGGRQTAGAAQGRLEAKIDLLLVTLDRVGEALAVQSGRGGRTEFLHCDALFRPGSLEWDEPLELPPEGTPAMVEVRAAAGHPVSTMLPATLLRQPAALSTDGGTRVIAVLAPMAAPLREAYERCIFILHRQSVRRAHAGSAAA